VSANRRYNFAVEQPAGSHSLAAAAHRGVRRMIGHDGDEAAYPSASSLRVQRREPEDPMSTTPAGGSRDHMTRRRAVVLGLAVALIVPSTAGAQQTGKLWRIGFLGAASRSTMADRVEAYREALRELGYVDGKNLAIEYRFADGQLDRLPALAAELVGLKVDLIQAGGTPVARAAKQATTTIPIVMTGGDPIRAGLVASLARPGGNVTGLADATVDVSTKRLELLKEAVPGLSQVAILWNPENPTNPPQLRDTETAAAVRGLTVFPLEARREEDLPRAFAAMRRMHAGGLVVQGDPLFVTHASRLIRLAATGRLPTVYPFPQFAEAGGLIAYGNRQADLYREAATYVDKILKGTKPADLPLQHPTRFFLAINLTTAKTLGLNISPSLLARADQVIQ
jgi:putative ABC transport system substrate-binding protein